MSFADIDWKTINTIRVMAMDATSNANSGHPGAPMGLAPLAHILFNRFMSFNPKNPKWLNRDRFVLSNGHACMLQYALLHLYGYNLSLEDIKSFRSLHSKTPGHPEVLDTEGIEVTTGPLGQGISNAVGIALAAKNAAAEFNKPGYTLFDNYTYAIFGDGCMMEGVASEACSLAGHLQLDNLIAFYDDNHITIDGDINCAFTEDVLKRFEAYGWHTICVEDGNNDLAGIAAAIEAAKAVKGKPTVIKVTTTIGFGSLLAGTHSVHGSPLKADDIAQAKKAFGFDPEKSFEYPSEVYEYLAKHAQEGAEAEKAWNELLESYAKEYPTEAAELARRRDHKLPEGWEKLLPTYTPEDPAIATRKLSETVFEKIYQGIPELIGGSADLTGSNLTRWKKAIDFQPPSTQLGDYSGRYIRYGVREHGMGAIMNGIDAFGLHIPYGGTFLNFVSYASGAVRLSAISQHHVIWVATHDSIGLGEDGPTHQPIETLAHFRALPNTMVWRPADGNEVSAAYYVSLKTRLPSIIALSRQNLPQLKGSSIEKAAKGGYVLVDTPKADIILVATGSEVSLAVESLPLLEENGIKASVVSLPDWYTFSQQSTEYQLSVLPDGVPVLAIEVLSSSGWQKFSHEQFCLDRFGASGAYKDVYKSFGFVPEGVLKRALATVEFYKDVSYIKSPLKKAFDPVK
ncbi:hypothetical protein CANCADRAFT_25657 [Tortispora caseinolytica NRRL Y-17796]|uniref:Transketolase n=1 Tax=Tortispora caseinolytica NRRL Y-17796 TaxID=767744 RepID=A0A1E4TF70_9ASCO|nr:hypothetical protein CANCADRAFT_25657 [Tortispora caseinolytica NRRL Y-17796]